MFDLRLATCEAALPPGAAPEWVHLLPPKGRITARDGRKFILDNPAALVADFNARGVDLPVDFAHQSELADAKTGGAAPRGRLDQGASRRCHRPLGPGGMDCPRSRDDRGAGIPLSFARVPA